MNTDRFKFRAWLIQEKRIVDVIDFKIQDDGFVLVEYKDTYTKQALIKAEHLMQCTGLKDKNDRLIFEGDILWEGCVLCKTGENFIEQAIRQTKWDYKKIAIWCRSVAAFTPFINGFSPLRFEILGNVYENPELLENK